MVYFVGKSEANMPKLLQVVVVVVCCWCQIVDISSGYSEQNFVGCFKERQPLTGHNESYRMLSFNVNIPDVTVQKCIDACAGHGYIFAGLQYGNNCWCGNHYYPLKSDGCDTPCRGNAAEKCGGSFINSVYAVCPTGYYNYEQNCISRCPVGCPTNRCYVKTGECLTYAGINLCEDERIKETCEQVCTNTGQGYNCSCTFGFIIQPNGECHPLNGIPPYAVMLVVLAILIPSSIGANLILMVIHKHRDKKYQVLLAAKREQEKRAEEEREQRGYVNHGHDVNANETDTQPHLYKKLQERKPVTEYNNNV